MSQMSRRASRELAFQYLYSLSANDKAVPTRNEFEAFCTTFERGLTGADGGTGDSFAWAEIEGTHSHLADVDGQIHQISKNWRIERMPRIDLTILRLATFEILYRPDVPKSVSINEAVELAKKFGSEGSAAFINGILDKIQKPA